MKDYAVFYEVNGNFGVKKISCFQKGEAYNWTVEDVSAEYLCDPHDVKIHTIIEIM